MQTLWGGYAVFAPELHLYFTGDTGYSKDFADIRERFAARQRPEAGGGFDLALIAIGETRQLERRPPAATKSAP